MECYYIQEKTLNRWMSAQRSCKRGAKTNMKNGGKLSNEKIELLDRLGFDWKPKGGPKRGPK